MSLFNVFTLAGGALSAQNVRLNTTASNLANADTVAASEAESYRSRSPHFRSVLQRLADGSELNGVEVAGIVENGAAPDRQYLPEHPLADEEGYVWGSNVNPVEEMANMISTSRSYQNNVEVMNTAKQLLLRTLSLGQ